MQASAHCAHVLALGGGSLAASNAPLGGADGGCAGCGLTFKAKHMITSLKTHLAMTAQIYSVLLCHVGALLDLTSRSTSAALASLSNLRCLWLSLSFGCQPDADWGWLQALQLTSIHLSDNNSVGAPSTTLVCLDLPHCELPCMYQTTETLRLDTG